MAASVAALTVYDMAKAIDKEMVVSGVRLVEKTKESTAVSASAHGKRRRGRIHPARERRALA